MAAFGVGAAGKVRQAVHRQVDLAGAAAVAEALEVAGELRGQVSLPDQLQEGAAGVTTGEYGAGRELAAVGQDHAPGGPLFNDDLGDRGLGADGGAGGDGGAGDGFGDGAGAPAGETPGAEGSVDLAHVVVQKHVGRAGGTHAEHGADDAGDAHGRLEDVGFEPLVEVVCGAGGHQLEEGRAQVRVHVAQALAVGGEVQQVAGMEGVQARGFGIDDGLHKARNAAHELAEARVDLRVPGAEGGDLPARARALHPAAQGATVQAGGEGGFEGQDAEAVTGEFEIAHDPGAQQADHIGTDGVDEARVDLLADAGAAEDMALFEDQDLLAGAGQVGGGGQAVVATADDDGVPGASAGGAAGDLDFARSPGAFLVVPGNGVGGELHGSLGGDWTLAQARLCAGL